MLPLGMIKIIEILMKRDQLSEQEATDQVAAFQSEMWLDVGQGGDIFEWEESFTSEFGLEPDFFEALIL
jgi:hypothetical protein